MSLLNNKVYKRPRQNIIYKNKEVEAMEDLGLDKLDVEDVMVLRRFYFMLDIPSNKLCPFPHPHTIKELHGEITESLIKMGMDALKKRLEFLVEKGFLKRTKSNPVIYGPEYMEKTPADIERIFDDYFRKAIGT